MGSHLGCFGTNGENETTCYVLVGVTGLSLLLLVVALVILVCVCYYKKKRRLQLRRVSSEEQFNPYSKDGKTQVLGFGEYAEVADAIHPNGSGADGEVRRSRVVVAERMPGGDVLELERVSLPPMRQRSGCIQPVLPLQLPPLTKSSLKRKPPPSSMDISSTRLKSGASGGETRDSTEHVYDSVDSVTTASSTPDAPLTDTTPKPAPIYHVLEGPTPITDSQPATPVNPQPVPPKPPRSRQRMLSCTVLDQKDSGGGGHPQTHSAVQTQLRPVMALYKGIHDRERSASSILLPRHVMRGSSRDGATNSEHMYHVLEGPPGSESNNTSRSGGKTQPVQHMERAPKVNSKSVSQACNPENAEESTVIKTTELGFQSGLPKMPSSAIESKKYQNSPLSITRDKPSTEDDSRCYAEPCINRQSECRLFDDPAYCTKPCDSGSQKLNSSDDSKLDTKPHNEPSYAMPMRSQQDMSLSSDSLFDDPKYNSPGLTPDSPTAHSLRIKSDEQRYNQAQRRHLRKCFLSAGRKSVCHSKSVDQFHPLAPSLSASHTIHQLDSTLKGHSLTNLSDQKKVNRSGGGGLRNL